MLLTLKTAGCPGSCKYRLSNSEYCFDKEDKDDDTCLMKFNREDMSKNCEIMVEIMILAIKNSQKQGRLL